MRTQWVGSCAAAVLAAAFVCGAADGAEPKLKVALTFDDLPLNGMLPVGAKQSDFARETIKVLKKYRIPPSYGFINAQALERNPDGANALHIDAEGFEIVTLEEAQKDAAYDYDPDIGDARGGTLVELAMQAKKVPWPGNAPQLPRERLRTICD